MQVHGSCYCGAIVFEAEVDPAKTVVCHCTDCQKLTGTVYRHSVPARAEALTLLSGKPKVFVKTAASGNKRAHSFCGNCGSPVFAGAAEGPATTFVIRVGTLDERALLPPMREIWCESALPYATRLETKSREPRQGGA